MIDLEKAQNQILEATPVLGRESIAILDALGRVLAQDIVAIDDLPASDLSAVDGYAVRHSCLQGASKQHPVHFNIIAEAPAGKPCGAIVGDGEAVRIMTGGLVPEGADTVVKSEYTVEMAGTVICRSEPGRGDGIRLRGESVRKGDQVLFAGDVVGPPEVGALASLRRAHVHVYRKPTVAILSTGNELSDFHEPATPWKAMCSNLYALAAQVIQAGALALCLGIARDDLQEQRAVLNDALHADVIITSGGTSRGKYDLIQKALAALGVEMRFSTIFAKPGKPTLFGTIRKTLVFGLPGNPSAAMLSFTQFIQPALLKMMGHPNVLGALRGRSRSAGNGDSLSLLDSFNEDHGGNKAHRRPSQIPLERCLSGRNGHRNKEISMDGAAADRIKIAAT